MSPDQKTTIIMLVIAFLPTVAAAVRRHHQVWAIAILNIACLVGVFPGVAGLVFPLGGGQLLLLCASGWVLSLVWAATAVRKNRDLVAIIDKAITASQKRQNTASLTGYGAVADALN